MATDDVTRILEFAKRTLAPYAERAFANHFGGYWVEKLTARGLGPRQRDGADVASRWDSHVLFKAVLVTWGEVFRSRLPEAARAYVSELKALRNTKAHEEPVHAEDVRRAADTARRLALLVGADGEARELAALLVQDSSPTPPGRSPPPPFVPTPESPARGADVTNPWAVLDDQRLLREAREQFGKDSVNPFYSNPDHTLRRGPIYLVAQNPGGAAGDVPSQTRAAPLDHPKRAASRVDWCKLLDEVWGEDGTNFQRNTLFIADELLPGRREGLRQTFCTNAVFVRGELTYRSARTLWDLCRPWHEGWLRLVRPRVLLCLGNNREASPYTWFSGLVQNVKHLPDVPTYNSAFKFKSCTGLLLGAPVTVIGMPHPARWSPMAPRSGPAMDDASRLVRAALDAQEPSSP